MDEAEKDFSLKDYFVPFTQVKAIIFIIFIGFLVFSNMLTGQFVWDDLSYISLNPDVHSVNLLALFKENSFNNGLGQYRALTATYFAVIYSFFGQTTFFYHLLQLIIHISNTVLLLIFFRKLFTLKPAFFLSLVFLVHPIQVESVSFIGATGNPLFFLFGISALLLSAQEKLSLQRLVIISSLLLLSLLTRETGLTFVFLVALYGFLFNRKNLPKLFCAVVISVMIYSVIRFGIGGIYFNNLPIKNLIPINSLPLPQRLMHLPAIIYFYLRTFFYPEVLAINQQWIFPRFTFANFFLPLFFVGLFFTLIVYPAIRLYRQKADLRWYVFFLLWFLAGLFIHSQVIPLDAIVADRWFYFPIVGLLGLICFVFKSISLHSKARAALPVVLGIIILLLAARTMTRNTNWSDNLTLFTHDAEINENYEMENNVAGFLSYAKRYAEALPHSIRSIELYPYDVNLSNLAYNYEQLGDSTQAARYYEKSIQSPNHSGSHDKIVQYSYFRWAGLYIFHGNPGRAKEILTQAVIAYPDNAAFWAFLAASQYELKEQAAALESATKAKTLLPNQITNNLYNQILNHLPVDVSRL